MSLVELVALLSLGGSEEGVGPEFVEDCKAVYETVLPRVLEGDTEDARDVYLYIAQYMMKYVAKVMYAFLGRREKK